MYSDTMKMAIGIILISALSGFNAGFNLPLGILEQVNPKAASDRCLSHGRIQVKLDNDDVAIQYFSRAIEINPANGWAFCCRAGALRRLGELDKAIQDEKQASSLGTHWLRIKETDNDAMHLALQHLRTGNHLASKKLLTNMIARNPKNGWLFYDRAQTNLALKDHKSAMSDLDTAVGIDKKNPWFLTCRADIKKRLGDQTGSARDYFYAGCNWNDTKLDIDSAVRCFSESISQYPKEQTPMAIEASDYGSKAN